MDTKNITELYTTLIGFVEAGDEEAARNFLTEHINEFPEELRKKIILEFFTEALDQEVESLDQKINLQKDGIDAIKEIEKTESSLKDQQKLEDVRSSIG